VVSDGLTDLVTGLASSSFRLPYDFTLLEVRAHLATASSLGVVTVDILKNGSSILYTKLTIDEDEKTSKTATTLPVIENGSLEDDSEITVDVVTAGLGARGLKITLIGTQ